MTNHTATLAAQEADPDSTLESVEGLGRAAFTERVRADMADPGVLGATRRLRREASAHDRQALRYEERVVMLRQLQHDGRF